MRKIAGRWSQCEISARRSCHGLDVLDGFHPSVSVRGKSCWLSPRATGTLPVIVQSPECCWTLVFWHDLFRKPDSTSRDHASCRQTKCACTWKSHDQTETPETGFPETMRKNARQGRA
jgi:hypothetical protein